MAALYLHVPHRSIDTAAFVTAATREVDRYDRPPFNDASFRMLYVGGGRPSRLGISSLQRLINACRTTLAVAPPEEITLELHPSDASAEYVQALRRLGITRLTIQGRSFVDTELRAVEASHSVQKLRTALRRVRENGFESASVDLVFGGLYQSLSTWKASLQRAVDLRVPHLTLHEIDDDETPSHGSEERADRFIFAMTLLSAKGYDQYELTHFARPGHRSRYQEHVYAHGNVLGVGPGAESFWWPERGSATAERWSNVMDATAYVERLQNNETPVARRETLDRPALAREYILLRLRTKKGLDLNVLNDRYDCPLRSKQSDTLRRLVTEGLIHDVPDRVRLTNRGRLLADAITQRLIREQ